jgi:hypothetical protein
MHWFFNHLAELLIAVSTGTLWWSTRRLWIATQDTLQHARDTTEIIQRAYVSAALGGLETNTVGHPIVHVDFKNVGHLPAYDLKFHIGNLTTNDDDTWKPPQILDGDLRQSGVLPIGTTFTRGSGPLSVRYPRNSCTQGGGLLTAMVSTNCGSPTSATATIWRPKEEKRGGGYRIGAEKGAIS